ncbi:MAG: (d)CMP kinase [Muribaculaceae bacterium]|nr:(d)CMP kinase [Muribaculaceae bacterium]
MKKITIAIDGFSSSGKSSMARKLAAAIGYAYIDSGAMYRAVALYSLDKGIITPEGALNTPLLEASLPDINIGFEVNPTSGVSEVTLNGVNVENRIRTLEVSNVVSLVAAVPAVRRALVAIQQRLGAEKGIVMDGRDIGTTVFPDAEMKVYVNADARVRAERRYKELLEKSEKVKFEDVLRNVEERDRLDMTRAESPLRKAPDAILLDNSHMSREQQNDARLEIFNRISKA